VRWLVTGATGFIGTALAERLLKGGDAVRALVRDPSRAAELRSMGAEIVRGDLGQTEALARAVPDVDVVVHLAGLVKAVTRKELFDVNAEGTRSLAEAVKGVTGAVTGAGRPRFVLVSSLAAAGPSVPGHPRSESDPPAPVSVYGQSKLAAEDVLRSMADEVESSIIRPPIVYGPRDKEFLPSLFQLAKAGLVLKSGLGKKHYSIVHVDDLVDLVIAVAASGERVSGASIGAGVYFVDDGVEHAWEALAGAALSALGRRGAVLPVPEAVGWLAAGAATAYSRVTGQAAILSLDKMMEIREPAWTCTSAKARHALGWRPRVTLDAGMREAVSWYRGRGLV
jgi:nucleoside-diphosphate-sugar epimerase